MIFAFLCNFTTSLCDDRAVKVVQLIRKKNGHAQAATERGQTRKKILGIAAHYQIFSVSKNPFSLFDFVGC
jgi:hypothetical protein